MLLDEYGVNGMSRQDKKVNTGEAAAALGSVWLGMAGLVFSHLWSVIDPIRANMKLLKIGSWIPGWWGIGPYAGKQTVALALWIGGWAVLHLLFKQQEVNLKRWIYAFLIGFAVLMLLIWPPIYHNLFGWNPAL